MPQMSPLSWIVTILLLLSLTLMMKPLVKSGKPNPSLQKTNNPTKTQLKWKW